MKAALFIFACLVAGPAAAHGPSHGGEQAAWLDILLTLLIVVPLILYKRGAQDIWKRTGFGRGLGFQHAAAYLAGMAILGLALLSPLHQYGHADLAAHMVQHVLLIAVAPLLIVLGRPELALIRGMPQASRQGVGRALRWLAPFERPLPASLLHAVAIWAWHAPVPFDAAVRDPVMHALEHACFFLTALLFWRSVLLAMRARTSAGGAILGTLGTIIQGGFLGALLTFSGRPLYAGYGLEEQQLAGLIMWVPASVVYFAAGLLLVARLAGFIERRGAEEAAVPREPAPAEGVP